MDFETSAFSGRGARTCVAGGGRNHVSHTVVTTVLPFFARPGDLAEAAAHSEFLVAVRAGNVLSVMIAGGPDGTFWPGTGSTKLEESM